MRSLPANTLNAFRILSVLGLLAAGGCASLDAAMHAPPSAVVTESRAIDLQLGGQ
jgi:hypothetical protein